jgi:4-hydroxy-4-methyl-2-oxoglutarate aldolase
MTTGRLLTEDERHLLVGVDTPTVCNVIELFDVRPRNAGYMDRRIQACFPDLPPMVGYASTATFRSNAPPRSSDVYASLDAQVERFHEIPGPPVVVFQDLDDPPVSATFGEVMCTAYRAFGAVGLITSGAGRDLQQVKSISFPCFTSSTICSHGYCHIPETHVPVHVGGITIYPGDLLHGDCNGVTTIPLEIARGVARACAELIEAEQELLDYLRSPVPTVNGFGQHREAMTRRFQELGQRIKRGEFA